MVLDVGRVTHVRQPIHQSRNRARRRPDHRLAAPRSPGNRRRTPQPRWAFVRFRGPAASRERQLGYRDELAELNAPAAAGRSLGRQSLVRSSTTSAASCGDSREIIRL